MNEKKPIGFYLKKVDELLSKGIDAVQSEFGISRFEWQILNVLKTNPSGHDEIAKELAPFIGQNNLDDTLTGFINKSFIGLNGANYKLTTEGENIFTNALEKQKIFREKSMKNVPAKGYQTTIKTLEQIINNLKSEN